MVIDNRVKISNYTKFDVFNNSQYKNNLTRRSSNKSILFGLS